jgi:hypothetical protein
MRAYDWRQTPLGPSAHCPASCRGFRRPCPVESAIGKELFRHEMGSFAKVNALQKSRFLWVIGAVACSGGAYRLGGAPEGSDATAPGAGGVGTTAGSSGAAARSGSSAAAGSSGSNSLGGTAGVTCEAGEKRCGETCVLPSPENGCSQSFCEPCPSPPANAELFCADYLCDVRCMPGFAPYAGYCTRLDEIPDAAEPVSDSGDDGPSDTDAASRCGPNQCPACGTRDGMIPCCTVSNTCGCGYPVAAALYCI